VEPTPDYYAEARRVLAPLFKAIASNTLPSSGYLHDHDEELEYARSFEPDRRKAAVLATASANTQSEWRSTRHLEPRRYSPEPVYRRHPQTEAYWTDTGALVMEYLRLQAGAQFSAALEEAFIAWVLRSPAEFLRYEQGDDMGRAAQVDWFLRVVR